jgi:hypothetical protein
VRISRPFAAAHAVLALSAAAAITPEHDAWPSAAWQAPTPRSALASAHRDGGDGALFAGLAGATVLLAGAAVAARGGPRRPV